MKALISKYFDSKGYTNGSSSGKKKIQTIVQSCKNEVKILMNISNILRNFNDFLKIIITTVMQRAQDTYHC